MLRLRIAGLPIGQFTEQRQLPVSGLDLSAWPEFSSPIMVHLQVDKTTESIVVDVNWETDVHYDCDRCAEPFIRPLAERLSLIYSFDEKLTEGEDESIFFISESTQEIDMSESLRQSLILALPVKRLCREACRGLCPQCGANWNTESCNCSANHDDPRWDTLKQLFKS